MPATQEKCEKVHSLGMGLEDVPSSPTSSSDGPRARTWADLEDDPFSAGWVYSLVYKQAGIGPVGTMRPAYTRYAEPMLTAIRAASGDPSVTIIRSFSTARPRRQSVPPQTAGALP